MSSNSNNYYYINIEKFNTIWQQKNMETYKSEYNRLGDIFKHEIDTIIKNTIIKNTIIKIPLYLINPVTSPYKNINAEKEEIQDNGDMKQCINDILYLYIKCKCHYASDYATIWNECLQNYLIAKIIFEKTEVRLNLQGQKVVPSIQNRTYADNSKINVIDNIKINIIADVFDDYNISNIYLFIQNLVEHLGILNSNFITIYFTKFINVYNTDNIDENWFLFYYLSLIVRNNFKNEKYGEGILKTIGKGGKRKQKSRITRKSYRTRKSRKSRKYKTRKSKKTRTLI